MYDYFDDVGNYFRSKITADQPQDCGKIISKLKYGTISANLKRDIKHHHCQTLDVVREQNF